MAEPFQGEMENSDWLPVWPKFAKRSAKMDPSRTDFGKLRFYSEDSFSEKVTKAAFGQRGSVNGQAA